MFSFYPMDQKTALYLKLVALILLNSFIILGSMYVIDVSSDSPENPTESNAIDEPKEPTVKTNTDEPTDKNGDSTESRSGEYEKQSQDDKFVVVKKFPEYNVVMKQGPTPEPEIGDYSVKIINKDENTDLATTIGRTTTFYAERRPRIIEYETTDVKDRITLMHFDPEQEDEKYKIGSYTVKNMNLK